MKRLIQTLFFVLVAQFAFSQCQAYFSSTYDSDTDSLKIFNYAYNTDSTPINVTSWVCTIQYGGMTYTSSNTVAPFFMGNYTGPVYACLTISTFLGCNDTYCDTIYVNDTTQSNNCIAFFSDVVTINPAGGPQIVDFTDGSIPEYVGVPFTYFWTFASGTPSTSTVQNPSVSFPGFGSYEVCLTVVSDSGCTDTYCQTLYIFDSTQNNCNLSVNSYISNVSSIGASDGLIDITVTGGTPPYTYLWNTGAVTEDIYGIPSGLYNVIINQSNALCSPYTMTFQVTEPYDSIPLDTLYLPVIDTCLGFPIDSFYVNVVQLDSMNATVTWTFSGGGMMGTITVIYPFATYGPYVIALSVSCDSSKALSTYMTYVNFTEYLGVKETETPQFRMYPNPVINNFVVELKGGITEVEVFNNSGQLMWSATDVNSEKLNIDASSWPAGVYIVRMTGSKGKASNVVIKK